MSFKFNNELTLTICPSSFTMNSGSQYEILVQIKIYRDDLDTKLNLLGRNNLFSFSCPLLIDQGSN